MKTFFIFCIWILSNSYAANPPKETVQIVGVKYLNIMFAHLHQNPSKYSATLTTVSCGHPVKLLKKLIEGEGERIVFGSTWNFVEVGPYRGYVSQQHLQDGRPECFQDKFSHFFDSFQFEITDLFYWGKLYDMMEAGRSKVK